MGMLKVTSLGHDRFVIDIRGFGVEVDQPLSAGGTDTGPTPTELFVSSLASCVAFYARRFLHRHKIGNEHLVVTSRFEMSDTPPARVALIDMDVAIGAKLSERQLQVLKKVVDACAVHNSIRQPPVGQIRLAQGVDELEPQHAVNLLAAG
jgi:uncharacterized OsmC-like protein